MNEILAWMAEHWIMTFVYSIPMFITAWLIFGLFLELVRAVFIVFPSKVLKSINVCVRGWPPPGVNEFGEEINNENKDSK